MPKIRFASGRSYNIDPGVEVTQDLMDSIQAYDDALQGPPADQYQQPQPQAAPTPQDPVAASQQQLNQAVERSFVAPPASMGGPLPPYNPEEATRTASWPTAAVRYGVPLAAGLATAGVGAVPAMVMGGITGAASEYGAQKMEGKESPDLKGVVASGIQGSVPVLKGSRIGSILLQGAGGVGAEAVRQGGNLDLWGAGKAAVVPMAISSAFHVPGAVAGVAGKAYDAASKVAQNIEAIGDKVTATVGQVFPSLSGLEVMAARSAAGKEIRTQLQDQTQAISDAITKLTGKEVPESQAVMSKLLQSLGAEDVASLSNAARNVTSAEKLLDSARGTVEEQLQKKALKEAQDSFKTAIENTLFSKGRPGPFRVVKAGDALENSIEKTKDAFRAHENDLYAPLKDVEDAPLFRMDVPVGKAPSIAESAREIMARIPTIESGGALPELRKLLNRFESMPNPKAGADPSAPLTVAIQKPASLQELRAIRNELYDFADQPGQAIGSNEQRLLKNLANTITASIYDQSGKVLPSGLDAVLKAANDFHAQFRPLFDNFGVKQAFKPETMKTGQMAGELAADVSKQGIDTPRFRNLLELNLGLQRAGVKNVPGALPIVENIRSAVVQNATDAATGALDYRKLSQTLNTMETSSPGTLSVLGFQNKGELDRFVQFLEKTPEAKGPDAIIKLLNTGTPAGFAIASDAVQTLPKLQQINGVMKHLEGMARSGNHMADNALTDLRAKALEGLLFERTASKFGKDISETAASALKEKPTTYEAILGTDLYETVRNRILPGFEEILDARARAGGAAAHAAVREAGLEAGVTKAVQAAERFAAGRPGPGVVRMFGDLAAAGLYKTASKALARAGSAEYKSAAEGFKALEQMSKLPPNQAIRAITDYANYNAPEEVSK